MTDLARIDANFKIETSIKVEGIHFYNVKEAPFALYGVFWEDGKYRRMPQRIADAVSQGVSVLNSHTAGGRVRFVTDSPYVAISVKMGSVGRMSHFTPIGSAGLDLYVRENGREVYAGSFMPPYDMTDGFDKLIEFKKDTFASPERKRREITINFPTYSEVKELYIGLDGDSYVEAPSPYVFDRPIVYYGHSITQGGCASRPGYVYPSILSRRFHCDFVNLGFSGSAMGEETMAKYLAGLDMKLLVLDYDYNAPDPQYLKKTHERMFRIIRKAQPDLPIILLTTTPKLQYGGSREARIEVVKTTYLHAIERGDSRVRLLIGSEVCDEADGPVGATVEGSHLNDVGFRCLADALGTVMAEFLR